LIGGGTETEEWRMKRIDISAKVWEGEEEKEAYVSKCPELEVASWGRTPAEALRCLKEAVELYLENAEELGIINPGADRLLNRSATFGRS